MDSWYTALHLLYQPEIPMSECLPRAQPVIRVVGQQLAYQVNAVRRDVRYELYGGGRWISVPFMVGAGGAERYCTHLWNAGAVLCWEVEVHVLAPLLHLGQQLRWRCAQDVVDLLDLIKLVGTREEREQRHNLKEDTANTPPASERWELIQVVLHVHSSIIDWGQFAS